LNNNTPLEHNILFPNNNKLHDDIYKLLNLADTSPLYDKLLILVMINEYNSKRIWTVIENIVIHNQIKSPLIDAVSYIRLKVKSTNVQS